MFVRKILLSVVLLFVFAFANAQNSMIYQNIEEMALKSSYTTAPDQNQKYTNFFISEIARSIPKKTEYTQYFFNCRKIDRINETEPGKYSATFEIMDAGCNGDVFYKGFSIADVLIPTNCSFTFSVFSDKAIPLYQTTVSDGILSPGYNILASYKFSDSSALKKFNTRVENFAFHYDENSISRFNSKLKLIDEYFLSGTTIDQCLAKIKEIDYGNTDMIIVYDISLKELEKNSEELYNKGFPGKLNLVDYDPVQFIDKYNKLSETLFNTRNQLNLKLENLDKLYYEKGLAEVEKAETAKAKMYFNRSVLYNPDFVPSQLEVAKILYHCDSLNAAADKISQILRTLKPTPDIYHQVILYTDSVYNRMLATGNEYNKLEKYNEAIEVLEKCVSFCDGLPGYSCGEKHVKSLAAARFGIYQSYLSVSQKAIDNGKYELAEIYISDARNYQKSYSSFIINDAEAVTKLDKIMAAYVAMGDTLISEKKYEKGLLYLEKAKNISEKNKLALPENFEKSISKARTGIYTSMLKKCSHQIGLRLIEPAEKTLNEAVDYQNKYSEIIQPSKGVDSLFVKIRYYQYEDLINSGLINQNMGNNQTALQYYDQAKKLEQEYHFKQNPMLDSLIQTSAKPMIETQIILIEKLITAAKTDSAISLNDRISKSMAIHGLSNDSGLMAKARLLKKNIYDLRCGQAKNIFDDRMKQANMAVARQHFMESDSLYSQAITVSDSFADCRIDANSAIDGKKTYLLPCNYQKMILKASTALNHDDYNTFLYNYSEAENFYINIQLNNYGLVHQKLTDLVAVSSDTSLIFAATDFMIQQNRPEDALRCLKTLQKMNYDALMTKSMQLQSGAMMARKDHAVNASSQPSVLVVSYAGNDKWLSYFRASYIKTWKSLNK